MTLIQQYLRVRSFLEETPAQFRRELDTAITDYLDAIADRITANRKPQTVDEVRRWEAGKELREAGLMYLIDQAAGSRGWCADGFIDEALSVVGVEGVLAEATLHSADDLIEWLGSRILARDPKWHSG